MTGMLAGVRIIDLTDSTAAYATKLLADLGADVIRVEPPQGDPTRRRGPFSCRAHRAGCSLLAAYLHTSKRSVTLNLAHPDGRHLFLRLLASAAAVVESDPPGRVAVEAALRWEDLREINPRLTYTRITPFGDDGPRAHWKATDLTLMAMGGLLWLAGEPLRPPLIPAGEQSGIIAGLAAAVGTLLALLHAEVHGSGQRVSISIQEAICLALENAIQFYDLEGVLRTRTGSRPREAGTGLFPCRDGFVYLMAGRMSTPRGWKAVVEWLQEAGVPGAVEMGDPVWLQYEYRTRPEAIDHFGQVFTRFASSWTKEDLYHAGQRRGIIICPVKSPQELRHDRQLAARNWFVQATPDAARMPVPFPGLPYALSACPGIAPRPAPAAGADNAAIFHDELGLPSEEMDALVEAGVI